LVGICDAHLTCPLGANGPGATGWDPLILFPPRASLMSSSSGYGTGRQGRRASGRSGNIQDCAPGHRSTRYFRHSVWLEFLSPDNTLDSGGANDRHRASCTAARAFDCMTFRQGRRHLPVLLGCRRCGAAVGTTQDACHPQRGLIGGAKGSIRLNRNYLLFSQLRSVSEI
jgi:hypothetical protein